MKEIINRILDTKVLNNEAKYEVLLMIEQQDKSFCNSIEKIIKEGEKKLEEEMKKSTFSRYLKEKNLINNNKLGKQ